MKFKRNLTSRDMFRIQVSEAMDANCRMLTRRERFEQALFAQRVRNCFFAATAFPINVNSGAVSDVRSAYTPAFSEATVITDIISLFDFKIGDQVSAGANWNNNSPRFQLQVLEYGTDNAYGSDLFGLSSRETSPQEFLVGHEKNYSAALGDPLVADEQLLDTLGKYLEFTPRLLKPYQRLQVNWLLNETMPTTMPTPQVSPQLGFRGVRVLRPDNPYGCFNQRVDQQIRNYIQANEPETFFLEAQFPFADLPAAGQTMRSIRTEQNDRPLLILGAITNLEGCQADIYDESKYYLFTQIDIRNNTGSSFVPEYKSVPLALWSPSNIF